MKPGRELNELVAEKIIGIPPSLINNWKECALHPSTLINRLDELPNYSTSIADAWKIIDISGNIYWEFKRELEWRNDGKNPPDQLPEDTGTNTYGVWKYIVIPLEVMIKDKKEYISYESMAHAICLASLKVIDATNKTD